jgi:hypothetical protein
MLYNYDKELHLLIEATKVKYLSIVSLIHYDLLNLIVIFAFKYMNISISIYSKKPKYFQR